MLAESGVQAVSEESSVFERWISKVAQLRTRSDRLGTKNAVDSRTACADALNRVIRMRDELQALRERNADLDRALADYKYRQTLIRSSR